MKALLLSMVVCALLLAPAWVAGGAGRMPSPEAKAVWRHITEQSPYTSWGAWPDYQGKQTSRSPHGPYHRVYVNQAGLSSTKTPVAHGTIEVKEVLTSEGKLKGVVVQYKVKGYNPQEGDWFWAKYTAQGRVRAEGKLAGCIACHSALKDNDYVMVHQFR